MLEFKIDSENPQLLRIAIAYDLFFENYGVFLDAAVAAEKKDKELVDEMEKLMSLSFGIADLFMLMSEVNQEENPNDNV
jgi:hypothetical protein